MNKSQENYFFKQQLEKLVKKSKKSRNQIEKELGYPRNALQNYFASTKNPGSKRLIEIADYFGVSIEYLLKKDSHYVLNKMLFNVRYLSLKEKRELLEKIIFELEDQDKTL